MNNKETKRIETKWNVTQDPDKTKVNVCKFCREIPEDCECSRGKMRVRFGNGTRATRAYLDGKMLTHRFLDTADMNRPGLDD